MELVKISLFQVIECLPGRHPVLKTQASSWFWKRNAAGLAKVTDALLSLRG